MYCIISERNLNLKIRDTCCTVGRRFILLGQDKRTVQHEWNWKEPSIHGRRWRYKWNARAFIGRTSKAAHLLQVRGTERNPGKSCRGPHIHIRTQKYRISYLLLVHNRHADILCITVDFVLEKIWLPVLFMVRLYQGTTSEDPSILKTLPHPHQHLAPRRRQIQTKNTQAKWRVENRMRPSWTISGKYWKMM